MSDVHRVIITAVGPDHPGLVDSVTTFVADCGGNLEDSRMVNLHGQFAVMMLVAGGDVALKRLQAGLDELGRKSGLHADLRPADLHLEDVEPAIAYRLNTWAMDHPGLMQSVAHVLGSLGVNIESAESTLRPAPYTSIPLFETEMIVSVPAAIHISEVREALGTVCDEMNIDWQLTAL